MNTDDEEMRDEYDFSTAERGKFYRPGAVITIPVRLRLGQELVNFLSEKADKKGVSLDDLINDVLEKEIALIQAIG
jgi:predicted HicB family RNase H-like nuclease